MNDLDRIQSALDLVAVLLIAIVLLQGVLIANSLRSIAATKKLWRVFRSLYGLTPESEGRSHERD